MNDPDDTLPQEPGEDEVRLDVAIQTAKDAAWRLEEATEGRRTVYDVVGCLLEDLVREGACPACLNETVRSVFEAIGADISEHIEDKNSVFH